jgi:hypothetical protein
MARYAKRLGDLCLLAGAPQDAKEHYENAISTGRPVGEHLFVACAHEGLAAAVLLEVAAHESGSAAAFMERYDQYGSSICLKTYIMAAQTCGSFVSCGDTRQLHSVAMWSVLPPAASRLVCTKCLMGSYSKKKHIQVAECGLLSLCN